MAAKNTENTKKEANSKFFVISVFFVAKSHSGTLGVGGRADSRFLR